MKELNITSFLMAIALTFLSYSMSFAQTSADCQSEVNLSVGSGCQTAIPYQAFNSWRPSCMVITRNGMNMAVVAGSGSFTKGKLNCSMQIDSVWIDTIKSSKINTYKIPMWTLSCDGGIAPDTIYADLSKVPALCKSDTMFDLSPGFTSAQQLQGSGYVLVNSKKIPTCPHQNTVAQDGDLLFLDTVDTYVFKQQVKKVTRVDTFSHTEALRWVKGTVILNVNGTDSIVHGFTPENGKKVTVKCGGSMTLSSILGGTVIPGPAVLTPGAYVYNSYSQDSLNYCWGDLNVEYKLWPSVASRKDTVSCVDVTAFDRSPEGGHYDYSAQTSQKLEDVCKWAEQIYTGGSSRVAPSGSVPGIGAMRSAARVQYEVNAQVKHCYTHTVTTKDRYIKDFNWLCDTVVKERSFIADKPAHGGGTTTGTLVKDTLMITPITLDDVYWPDTVLTLKCGILEGDSPDEIAEYLYKAYKHFGNKNTEVITGRTDAGSTKGFIKEKPCDAFASQYDKYDLGLASNSSLAGNDGLWEKVFKGADYNNWGVKRAFPYTVRKNKLTDQGLKAKMSSLILSGDVTKADSFAYAVDSVLIPINKIVCNIAATKIDLHPANPCGGEKKVFRQWTLVDWCTGTTTEKTQIIKFVDADAPSIVNYNGKTAKDYFNTGKKKIATGDSVLVKNALVTSPWGCYAAYTFPMLGLKEHCSEGKYYYELLDKSLKSDGKKYQAGQTINMSWSHGEGFAHPIVKVRLYDDCANEGSYHYYLYGQDKLPPIVVLHDNISVTLTANKDEESPNAQGIAKVFCADVDAGSHDGDCGSIKECKVRIKGTTEWTDGVHFGCADVGEQVVEYRAEDWSGNTSIGWTTVNVVNKLSAALICENVVIGCTDAVHPDWLGYPHVSGICSTPELEWEDEYDVDELCFKGSIKRTWTVVGSDPKVTCVQTITIDSKDNGGDDTKFDPKSIKFPLHHTGQTLEQTGINTKWISIKAKDSHDVCRDFTYDAYNTYRKASNSSYDITADVLKKCKMNDPYICEAGQGTEPTWTDPTCGLVGKTFTDQTVEFGDGSCYKILRSWAVIDWCTYDAKKGDVHADEVEYVKDLCENSSYFRIRTEDHPKEDTNDGYYAYTQEIKILDLTVPVVMAPDTTVEVGLGGKNDEDGCELTADLTAFGKDFCGDTENVKATSSLEWTVRVVEVDHAGVELGTATTNHAISKGSENGYATGTISLKGRAGSIYRIKWTANDGCGNSGVVRQTVHFLDIKAPVMLCYQSLSTSTMNTDGTTEIWANDFGKAFDCDGEEVPVWFKDAEGALVPYKTYSCDDLDGNTSVAIAERIYGVDAAGNESFCEVTLRIIDGSDACGNGPVDGAALISGAVRTSIGDMVESAEVAIAQDVRMTSTDGLFAFENTPMGQSYELKVQKNDDYLNGVSTLDLVLIQKHILGLESFEDAYKVIAADINNDESVSAIDLIELRKLILGSYIELPNNASWRFADANFTFEDVAHPFPFTETINVDFLTSNRSNDDFIAIKVGDVSGNAIANSLIASERSNTSITLTAQDANVNAGELIRLDISSEEFVNMNALQFTMGLSGLEYVAVEAGALDISDDNLAIFDDRMTAAWFDVNEVSSDNTLFTLVFRANQNTVLSNAISIGSAITQAKAYTNENESVDVTLAFETRGGLVDGSTFELFQNQPNPFDNITTIGFQLAEAGAAKMTVFDVTGKIVSSIQGQYTRGYNEISISKTELGTSGVLYYQLESGDFTATRKMILID